jgi:preprotein translocase subunit SecF
MKMFQIYPYDATNNIMGKRRIAAIFSAILIAASLLLLAVIGPSWGIDFRGGTEVIVQFEEPVDDEAVRQAAERFLGDPLVQRFGAADQNSFIIQTADVAVVDETGGQLIAEELEGLGDHERTDIIPEQPDRMEVRYTAEKTIEEIEAAVAAAGVADVTVETRGQAGEHWYSLRFQDLSRVIRDGFSEEFGDAFDPSGGLQRLESVGPRAGEQLRNDGMLAMIVALGAILLYIWFRFDMRYSPGAVAALTHDIIIALGFFVIFGIEISLPIVAALLTIIGYSLNDTIVVFDRIRENLDSSGDKPIVDVVNEAINQTMSRTLITSLTTFGAVTTIAVVATGLIQDFALALMIGVAIGTYSSIFVASPVMLKMDGYLKERRQAQELLDQTEGDKSLEF